MDCRTRLALTTSLLALAAGPVPAQQAAPALEEIIVTARKREESLRDVPAAVTALDQRALEALGVASFADLHNKVPELTVRPYPQGGSALTLSMRGISQTDAVNISLDPGVGIYLDDVYLARGQALTTDLGDLERIEVLRGPQGTLYGRNTIGGAVKFVTAKPTGRFGFKQKFDYGRFGTVRSLTSVNLPETAGFSLKATYLHAAYDGFVGNRGTGGQFGEKEQQGWRAALRWRPADIAVTVDYVFDGGFQDGVSPYQQRAYAYPLFPFAFPLQPGAVRQAWRPADLPMNDDFRSGGHALSAAWDIADDLTLKSTTSYRRLSSDQLVDSMEAFNVTSVVGTNTKQHQLSEELNLSGSAPGLGLKYILGAFYFRERASQRNMQTLVPDAFTLSFAFPYAGPTAANVGPYAESTATNRSVGGYANVSWTPDFAAERLSIDLGGRYSSDTRDARAPGTAAGHVTHSSFDPSVTVDWRWTPDLHSYAKAARGYRTGGFNLRNSALAAFGPERLYSYEIGLKSTLLDGRVFFDAAAFIQKYRDIQLTFTEVGSFPLNVVTVNAGRNTTKGVEAALTVAPADGLRLSGNLAWLKATNIRAADPFTGVAVAGGFPPPEVPRWAYTLSGEYTLPPLPFGTPTLQATWAYNGRQQQYSGQVADLRPGYGLLGARATLGDIEAGGGTASVALWGNNLTNKAYQLYHSFGGVIMGEPLAYGVTLTYSY